MRKTFKRAVLRAEGLGLRLSRMTASDRKLYPGKYFQIQFPSHTGYFGGAPHWSSLASLSDVYAWLDKREVSEKPPYLPGSDPEFE